MPRPDLKSALGREAVYADTPPAPEGARGPRDTGRPKWDETHSRATFHLPRDLQQAIAAEATRSGRSKSQVVADALRQHLAVDG